MIATKWLAESILNPGHYYAGQHLYTRGALITRDPEAAVSFAPGAILPPWFRAVRVTYRMGASASTLEMRDAQ